MKFVKAGDYLTDTRKASKLTQTQIANALKLKSPQFVSNAERGLCLIPAKYFKKLNKVMPKFNIGDYIEFAARDAYHNTISKLKQKA
jgi:transcriptional regulator with XRE-family HTH domain